MKGRKELILLTHYYPYGKKESYIETEVKYLSASFKKVHIFNVGKHSVYSEKRTVPENCSVLLSNHHKETEKIFSLLKNIFSILFFEEIFNLIFYYKKKPTLIRIKAILVALRSAKGIKNSIQNKIDLSKSNMTIYSYWSDENATAIAMLAKKAPRHKYISRAHGYDLYFERSAFDYLPFKKLLIKYLDQIHFISNDGLNYFKRQHQLINTDKLFLSRLGVERSIPEIKKEKKKENYFTILSNSYVYPNKRVNLIAEVISKLDAKINWYHIGNAAYDKEHFKILEKFSEQVFADKKNINYYLLGRLSNSEVENFLKTNNIDLFINLSLSEGIPVTFMEVMTLGIPVFATNVGGVNEIINEKNGVLIEKNLNALKISKILSNFISKDVKEIDKYRFNAFQQWEKNYNASNNYQNFIKKLK